MNSFVIQEQIVLLLLFVSFVSVVVVVSVVLFLCDRSLARISRSRCGCGGAQVFECVHDLMGRIERRRSTLDDCDDRRRDRVQRERPEVEI